MSVKGGERRTPFLLPPVAEETASGAILKKAGVRQ